MVSIKAVRKTKAKTKSRKQGGQPGNKNAMRHGFYAKRFTAEEQTRLDSQDSTDVQAEIALIRVCMDRLTNELNFKIVTTVDMQGNITRDDHYLKQLNTLGLMTQSLSTLTRTHYLIKGKGGDVADAIMTALEELRLEMGI